VTGAHCLRIGEGVTRSGNTGSRLVEELRQHTVGTGVDKVGQLGKIGDATIRRAWAR